MAAGILFLLAAAVVLMRQPLGRAAVQLGLGYLARSLHVTVSYEQLHGDIFSSPRFRGLRVVLGPDSATARELAFSYDLPGLLRGRFSLSEVDVQDLAVYVSSKRPPASPRPDSAGAGPRRFPRASLGRLRVSGGRLFLDDSLRIDSLAADLGLLSAPEQLVVVLDSASLALVRERLEVRRVRARCRLTAESLHVSRLELATAGSRVSGSLALALDSAGAVVRLDSASVDLGELTEYGGRVQATGSASAARGARSADLRYVVDGLGFAHLALPTLRGRLTFSEPQLEFTAEGSDSQLGQFSVDARLDITELSYEGRALLEGTMISALDARLPAVSVDADVRFRGRKADTVAVELRASAAGFGVDRFDLDGRYTAGVFRVQRAELQGSGGRLRATGSYDSGELAGECELDTFDLSLLARLGLAEVEGRVTGSCQLAGGVDSLTAAGNLRGTGLRVPGFSVDGMVAEFDLGVGERIAGRLAVGGESVSVAGLSLDAAQLVILDSELDLRVDRAEDQLLVLGTLGFLSRGGLECDVSTFQYATRAETLALARPFGVRWQGDTLAVSGMVYEVAGGTLSLDAMHTGGRFPSVDARGENLDLAKLGELFRLPFEIGGSAGFRLSGDSTFRVVLTASDIAVPSQNLVLRTLDAEAVLSESTAEVDHVSFVHRVDTTRVSGEARFRLDGGLTFENVDVVADIRDPGTWVLGFLRSTVDLQDGVIYGLLSLQGRPDEPDVGGRLRITRGTVYVPSVNATVERVTADFTADGDRITLQKLTGGVGRGIVTVTGLVDLGHGWQVDSLRFRVIPDGAAINPMPEVYAVVGGEVLLHWAAGSPFSIAGDIDVEEALLAFGFGPSSATAAPTGGGEDSLVYDIRVSGDRGIWFRNEMLDIEMSVDLTLHRSMTEEVYSGRLASRQGNIYYLDHTLRVAQGVVQFDNIGQLNPTLDIVAEMPVRSSVGSAENLPDKVLLTLAGTLEKPEFRFASDPPGWDENEIITYLSLNVTTEELSALENREVVTRYLSERFLGYLQTRGTKWARKYIGLDELRLESELAGAEGYKVTVGKYVGRNIYVTYTQNFTGELQPEFTVEYYMNRRNEIVGARSADGRYSVRYRLRLRY